MKMTDHRLQFFKEYLGRRLLAKFIDGLIIAALSMLLPPIGALGALAYSLLADGILDGQSIGKKLIGLTVIISREGDRKCGFYDSALRNISITAVVFISLIPLFNYVLLPTVGLAVIGFETYLLVTDDKHQRIGDILAGSAVV